MACGVVVMWCGSWLDDELSIERWMTFLTVTPEANRECRDAVCFISRQAKRAAPFPGARIGDGGC